MALDPTRIHVESNVAPVWERDESFQDIMSEQLQRAPWFALSVFIHLIAAGLLWALMPDRQVDDTKLAMKVEKVVSPPRNPTRIAS